MKKISSIISGWKNYFIKDPKIEKLFSFRYEMCKGCPFRKKNVFLDIITFGIYSEYCKQCGCPLKSKLRSRKERCPMDLW